MEILACEVKELRNKKITLVKVLWRNHKTKEATWESEETMWQQYPQLFKLGKFRGRNFLKWGRVVTPQKYPRIFVVIFIIYSGYELSKTWVFQEKLINCEK